MKGAEALLETMVNAGIDVCFANPGTSEMALVAALDDHPSIRSILGLFEGVVTGAADGFGRMADRPAATLLHLGPGLANGLANMHNARRARTPMVNIVGEHATDHLLLDAPLTSDIAGLAAPMSDWVETSQSADDLAEKGRDAVAFARSRGGMATLIVPADHAWSEGASPRSPVPDQPRPKAGETEIAAAADALCTAKRPALFLGGSALREDCLAVAGTIAEGCGARIFCETFPARLERGAGRVPVERLAYFGEAAAAQLADFDTIIFVSAKPPVAFFAYPGKPGTLSPSAARLVALTGTCEDPHDALERLGARLGYERPSAVQSQFECEPVTADALLTPAVIGTVLAELLPENAIVSDEATTAGPDIFARTAGSCRHDWLTLTGGAIGQGLPVALGAAVACPDRHVIALQSDGAALYTLQALWTMARENVDVTVILFANSTYAILNIEFGRIGLGEPGKAAASLFSLADPLLDWVNLAKGMGITAHRARDAGEFRSALESALRTRGPQLIEAIID